MDVPIELRRQRDALSNMLVKMPHTFSSDLELLGHWGRYTCVLAAGFLENSLRLQFSAYSATRAQPKVANFVVATLDKIQNPKATKFVEVTKAFDDTLATRLQAFLNEDSGRRKNAIDSIMTNRHQIAHGRTSTVTIRNVTEWFKCSCEVVEFIASGLG